MQRWTMSRRNVLKLGALGAGSAAAVGEHAGALKVRDPLSERVHLGPIELLAYSLNGIASEIGRRAVGRA